MPDEALLNLEDCTEFRQTLLSKSPRLAHVTGGVIISMIAAGFIWAAWARANLIVQAPGRIRPLSTPIQIFSTFGGEFSAASFGSRVVAVYKQEGDVVKKGEALLKVDSSWIDAESRKQKELLEAGDEEIAQLKQSLELLDEQFAADVAKQQSELARSREEYDRAVAERDVTIKVAEAELAVAREEAAIARQVATKAEQLQAMLKVRQQEQNLAKAQLPVPVKQIEVLERTLDLTEKNYAVKKNQMRAELAAKQGQVEAARRQLEKLQIEQDQAVLRSPIDGVITQGKFEPGNVLQRNNSVYEVAKQDGLLFEGFVMSADVGLIEVGMKAPIKLDTYYFQKFGTLPGVVEYVAPDSTQQEQGEQKAIVYMVRIAVPDPEFGPPDHRVRAGLGMSGVAEIVTDNDSILALLFKKVRQSIRLD